MHELYYLSHTTARAIDLTLTHATDLTLTLAAIDHTLTLASASSEFRERCLSSWVLKSRWQTAREAIVIGLLVSEFVVCAWQSVYVCMCVHE